MKHRCHAIDCTQAIPERHAMCARHWRMVRPAVQRLIRSFYRPGQEKDKRPSLYYQACLRLARAIVAHREEKFGASEIELDHAEALRDRAKASLAHDLETGRRAVSRAREVLEPWSKKP